MAQMTRRHILKAGLVASAGFASPHPIRSAAAAELPGFDSTTGPPGPHFEPSKPSPRQKLLMDFGWRFHLGDAADPRKDFGFGAPAREGTFAKASFAAPAAEVDFDDSGWQPIDLPHDWALGLPFVEGANLSSHGSKPLGREFPQSSIGWYRRKFSLQAEDEVKRIHLRFDGVFRDATVFLNGHYLGRNFSGYLPFEFDVTDYANFGGENLVTLRADATFSEGWFYEGAGIYRHVWLTKVDPVHIASGGLAVRSELRGNRAQLSVSGEVSNHSGAKASCRLSADVFDPAGDIVATIRSDFAAVPSRDTLTLEATGSLPNPKLWSLDDPHLYRVVTRVETASGVRDCVETNMGVRTIQFDPDQGFLLNGKPVRIKGTCNHQDHAGVGTAIPDSLHVCRVEMLKELGSNACRTAHNPVASEFLDACDRLGMLVLSEVRTMASTPEGIDQLERMVRRDRNHPSIFLWSLANEEPDQDTSTGARIVATMKQCVRRLDPDGLVTAAMNGGWGQGISSVVDVQGFNYSGEGVGPFTARNIDGFHRSFPKKPTIATETTSLYSTRGIYKNDPRLGYVSAYDENFPDYSLNSEGWWTLLDERPFLSGGFVWTGFDYRGEPSPYADVSIGSQFGIMDTCGFPKDIYYYYRAWWRCAPILHLFPHWNWNGMEGQEIRICCFSNLEEVELLLNGRSLGRKPIKRNSHQQWTVPYEPGAVEARGYRGGAVVLTDRRETTSAPSQLAMRADRQTIAANGEDVVGVVVEVQDSSRQFVPTSINEIHFYLDGPGEIVGVGNGDPSCRESDKPITAEYAKRSAFNGLCMLFVKSLKDAGTITISATGDSLGRTQFSLESRTVECRPSLA
jgi:beta-galactosidase